MDRDKGDRGEIGPTKCLTRPRPAARRQLHGWPGPAGHAILPWLGRREPRHIQEEAQCAACAHARGGFPKEHACHPKLLRTSGDPRDEGLQRDETQARLVAEAQQRQQQPKRHAAPAGWPPSDEPAAAPAPALTVHDLYSGAPVVTEAPAGDGGLQSLHDSHATWSRRVKKNGSANGHRHSGSHCRAYPNPSSNPNPNPDPDPSPSPSPNPSPSPSPSLT